MTRVTDLPDDMLRHIASRLSNRDASMLSMASKNFRAIVKNTHPDLPIKPPSYAAGTGKYQRQFREVVDASESYDRIRDTDLALFYAMVTVTHDMEYMMRIGRGIRYLKSSRASSRHYKKFYNQVKDRLRRWKGARYADALCAMTRRTVRDDDDAAHATAVFDAVVMVAAESIRSMLL